MMIKLTVPSYFTDYRTPEQKYNDNYLENFLYLRLLKHLKFINQNETPPNQLISELITLIETSIGKNLDNIQYLNYYDGENSKWSNIDNEKLNKRKIKYEEMANQKGGGQPEIDFYKENKKVDSIKNYPSYAELINSSNFSATLKLIPEDLKKLCLSSSITEADILNLLMGRNVDISTCNDNIRYILAESKYRSIRDSPIIPENDKVIECEKLKKTLKEIINENNDKCPNKIKMPDDSYWLNYHNNRSFYAVNYSCENFIVPVPYNKFAGDKIVMEMEQEESFETILQNIHKKCLTLESKIQPKPTLGTVSDNLELLFGASSSSSQIKAILSDLFLNKTFNPHEFIEYRSIEAFNSGDGSVNFLKYLLEYFRPHYNINEESFDYNLQSPVVFSYTINNSKVVEPSQPPTLKPNFNCSNTELPADFNYDNYYFVNVPPYLKRGNYFQVNILPDGAITNNIFKRKKNDNYSLNYQPKFIKFNVDNPSNTYSILLLNKGGQVLTPAYYIQTVPIPTTDTKKNTGEEGTNFADAIIIELYTPKNHGRLMIKLTQYASEMIRTPLSDSLSQLYTEFQTYSQETQYDNTTLSTLLNRYKLLETQFKNLPIYAKEESEYKTFIKTDYEKMHVQGYEIKQTIEEVTSYHKFAKIQKTQTFIYPNYPGLTTFYAPLNTPIPFSEVLDIEIIDDASQLVPPPPPYPRLSVSGKKSSEQIFQEEQAEQQKYNLSDADFSPKTADKTTNKILDPARIITKYIGERNASKQKHGFGVAYYKNGNKYEGIWVDDVKDGPGISTEIVNYVTGEIGCVCKFYYRGFNILNNQFVYPGPDSFVGPNKPPVSVDPNQEIKNRVAYIIKNRPNIIKRGSQIIENIYKYIYTYNFEEEVEEEESINAPVEDSIMSRTSSEKPIYDSEEEEV